MPIETTMTLATVPVFYSEKMVANFDSYSPSAAKPKAVVSAWKQLGLPVTLIEPTAARRKQLELAHDAIYVADVLNCATENGFGNRSPEVALFLASTSEISRALYVQ